MSTWLRVLLLLAAGSQCINAYCNETAVKSIKNFWGKKPTHVYLQKLVGTLTYVWISPSILGGQNLTCFQTTVATDEMSVKDYMVDVDGSTSTSIDYFYLLERPGYITLTSPGSPDDWAHVVYFNSKRHVMAYYQCSPTGDSYEPFVAVVAVNYKKNSLAIARAIRAAIAVLDKLGINTGSSIRTDCSTFVRNSTIIYHHIGIKITS